MRSTRYVLLIQKQFDIVLTDREQYELQGFLDGNEAAAKFVENLGKVIEECSQTPIEIHEHLLHPDPAELFESIIARLSSGQSVTWFGAIVSMIKTRKSRTDSRDQTEIELLRAKNKGALEHNAAAAAAKGQDPGASLQAARERIKNAGAQSLNADSKTVSLAEAIKQRVARNSAQDQSGLPTSADANGAAAVSDSMDMIFNTSSHCPIYVPAHNEADENIKLNYQSGNRGVGLPETPVEVMAIADWEAPPKANQWQATSPANNWQTSPSIHDWETKSASNQDWDQQPGQMIANERLPQGQMIRASASIPVDDIIAHVSSVFMEQEETAQRSAQAREQSPACEILPIPNVPSTNATGTSSSGIPVDDIIAHVSNLFMEHEPKDRSMPRSASGLAARNQEPVPDQFASGNWPQVNCLEFDRSRLARLGTTIDARSNSDTAQAPGGQITSFGQFILDKNRQKVIGAIADAIVNLPTAKILSEDESVALRECLRPIEEQEGVAGCLIIGYDGMIITTTLPQSADGDAFSAWALLTYMNSQGVVKQLGHKAMKQIISRTASGYLLLADFGQGLLLAVSENASTEAMLPLMKSVRRVTAA